jgi:hypothetical protein
MKTSKGFIVVLSVFVVVNSPVSRTPGGQTDASNSNATSPSAMALDSLDGLEIRTVRDNGPNSVKVKADVGTYKGRRAVRMLNDDSAVPQGNPAGGQSLAIVKGSDFKDGTIELDIVGMPREGAPSGTRGFVGIAFHVQDHGSQFEAFYLRFTNGRADDQLQRNHTTQYVSEPDYQWFRLRRENPGVYESYVDLEEKTWTKIRVVVAGTRARLYVNGAAQPCLIVNDLKLGETRGQVALWNGSDTESYFSHLRIE